MRLFECTNCGQTLHFENRSCERCGHRLGYAALQRTLLALEREEHLWRPVGALGPLYRFCENAGHDACNWLVPAERGGSFCEACRHNRTIPDLSVPTNLERWRRIEWAKHRLIYSLLQLRLPLVAWWERTEGLGFDLLADPDDPNAPHVLTGHAAGLITLNIAEADDAERESRRTSFGEPYRTLLGHFRHEIGHYYWDRLIRDGPRDALGPFRDLFGDERADYGEALKRYYAEGPAPEWREHCISAYASSHPWEDFAETWAHYLHMVDTLETAGVYGLRLRPHVAEGAALSMRVDFDSYGQDRVEPLIEAWTPLTLAVNSLNRSMGLPDLYPFVLSPAVVDKLGFVHDLIRSAGKRSSGAAYGADTVPDPLAGAWTSCDA